MTDNGGGTQPVKAPEAEGESPAAGPDAPVALPEAYVIPRALAQATLDYLAVQPYREVFSLVQAFEALEPLGDPARPR